MSIPATLCLIVIALLAGGGVGWVLCRRKARREVEDLRRRLARAFEEARTDPLTGVWNRKAFDEQLRIQTAVARRYGLPFSLIILDIDHFKRVNDDHGHAAGDAVLQHLAGLLRSSVREADLIVRQGGDEFALLLPQTGLDGAVQVAERIRRQVASAPFPGSSGSVQITLSGGVVSLIREEPTNQLLHRADAALYQAKRGSGESDPGRNRIFRDG